MNKKTLDVFEKLVGQIESFYDEISVCSKKNPDAAINAFKLQFVNKLLLAANEILADRYRPFEEFSTFDDEKLPSNSDVGFILSQYLQCFEKLRADNVVHEYGNWYWALEPLENEHSSRDDGRILVKTTRPKRLRE